MRLLSASLVTIVAIHVILASQPTAVCHGWSLFATKAVSDTTNAQDTAKAEWIARYDQNSLPHATFLRQQSTTRDHETTPSSGLGSKSRTSVEWESFFADKPQPPPLMSMDSAIPRLIDTVTTAARALAVVCWGHIASAAKGIALVSWNSVIFAASALHNLRLLSALRAVGILGLEWTACRGGNCFALFPTAFSSTRAWIVGNLGAWYGVISVVNEASSHSLLLLALTILYVAVRTVAVLRWTMLTRYLLVCFLLTCIVSIFTHVVLAVIDSSAVAGPT